MRMAMSTPWRISGSPPLRHQARERRPAFFAVRATSLPVSSRPQDGGVDEQRRALAQVRLPVAVADLVADQRIARGLVGDAQQRLGQAHQRHAFLAGQRELLQQRLP
jgi:hypothetical protein